LNGVADPDDQGPARSQRADPDDNEAPGDGTLVPLSEIGTDASTLEPAPPPVAELADACVRFVAQRYGLELDFTPETLSLVDHWVGEARGEVKNRAELAVLVQGAAGAYFGEVVRRSFGGFWRAEGDPSEWRLMMSTVYCAFNPIGVAREALLLEDAEGWHAHFELDPAENQAIEARLAALPSVPDVEFYAPSTRFDVVHIVVDALRDAMRARGLGDTRFTVDDYGAP
jgi:hypothetical protein